MGEMKVQPGKVWRVFWNGVELAQWIAFDPKEGWVLCPVHDENGRPCVDADGEALTTMLRGEIVAVSVHEGLGPLAPVD